jgi:hypothetical protein
MAGAHIDTIAEFTGDLKHGFFDNQILSASGVTQAWNPDPETYDPNKDTGILIGSLHIKRCWRWFVPPWLKPGLYVVRTAVYDDPSGTNRDRHQVAYVDLQLSMTETNDPKIKFLCRAYRNILDREADDSGLRTWYIGLQQRRVSFGQLLEQGFAKSPEFQIRSAWKVFGSGPLSPRYENWHTALQTGSTTLSRICHEIIEVAHGGRVPGYAAGEQEMDIVSHHLFEGALPNTIINKIKTEQRNIARYPGDYLVAVLNNDLVIRFFIAQKFFEEDEKNQLGEMLERYIKGEITIGEAMERINLFV